MARHDAPDASSIDELLLGLTSRPNVLSTLILSRADGSIIKATGAIAGGTSSSGSNTGHSRSQENEKPGQPKTSSENTDPTDASSNAVNLRYGHAAERLATAIHHFVGAATILGTNLNETTGSANDLKSQGFLDQKQRSLDAREAGEQKHGDENEIQLLRMRTKRQEVIIFPDSKFLCCVVQSIEKTNR